MSYSSCKTLNTNLQQSTHDMPSTTHITTNVQLHHHPWNHRLKIQANHVIIKKRSRALFDQWMSRMMSRAIFRPMRDKQVVLDITAVCLRCKYWLTCFYKTHVYEDIWELWELCLGQWKRQWCCTALQVETVSVTSKVIYSWGKRDILLHNSIHNNNVAFRNVSLKSNDFLHVDSKF